MTLIICGGVISESQHRKNVEEYGVWADTMSWVMEDKYYERYVKAVEAGKAGKEVANRLFKKYAISQI